MFKVNQIIVDVPDCPRAAPPNIHGIPTWIFGWGMAITFVIIAALIVGIVVARISHNENTTERQNNRQRALVDAARLVQHCPGCGMKYSIEDELKKVGP